PSYTSAHSTVSAAAAGVLTALFGSSYHFTVTAEGVTYTRSFDSFGAAAEEAGQSRIYGGIHYQVDNVARQQVGHRVADYVGGGFLRPRDDDGDDQLRAAAAAPAPGNASLRAGQVPPLLAEALARWQAAGVDTPALGGITVRIADLGGLTLGEAAGGGIWLGDNPAGGGGVVGSPPPGGPRVPTPRHPGGGGGGGPAHGPGTR